MNWPRTLQLLLVGIALVAVPLAVQAGESNLDRAAAARTAGLDPGKAALQAVPPVAAVPERTAASDLRSGSTNTGRMGREPRATRPAESARPARAASSAEPNSAKLAVPEPPLQTESIVKRMLYAPTVDDDPAYRAAIAAETGGIVDYYDARSGTPTALELATYDCVYTWVSSAYADADLFGNRLADYVDAGGKVILGVFCTFTAGSFLGGRIMTPGYCPVTSPSGSNHYSSSGYAGDGASSLHAGVLAYDSPYRDILVPQGDGIVDGHYADGEIAHAYRPDGRVIYSNGLGGSIGGAGDWPRIIANLCNGDPTAPGMLYAPANPDDELYRLAISSYTGGPVHYLDAGSATPSALLLATYDCVYTYPNYSYQDDVLMGDRLADFVDAGGRAILGVYCTYAVGNALYGRVMSKGYCPVASPSGTGYYSLEEYLGDGATPLHEGVLSYAGLQRDILIGLAPGIVDGHYQDGTIAAAYRPDGRVIYLNGMGSPLGGTGDWPRLVANAATAELATGPSILMAPAVGDDVDYRNAIAACTGGVVDYFDATAGTPSSWLLAGYDCVYTWADGSYEDRDAFGDRLADYVDAGGKVILGTFCTFTQGNSLGGRIMQNGYCPVASPGGDNHYSAEDYAGDGTTCFHHGVLGYASQYRDYLVPQGAGVVDGTYLDGEVALAYRPDRRVVYLNGGGGYLGGGGEWPLVVANAARCGQVPGALYASTNQGALVSLDPSNGEGHFIAPLPSGEAGCTEIEFDEAWGMAWLQGGDGTFAAMPFDIATGMPLAPWIPNYASFNGLEFALDHRLYGTAIEEPCGPSYLVLLDPVTGNGALVGATGGGPVAGLAFDPRESVLYGVTGGRDCGAGPGLLHIDITSGQVFEAIPTATYFGGLEYGPDGDLYAGSSQLDGGRLYRVNPTSGAVALIGEPGFGGITGLAFVPAGTVVAVGAGPSRLSLATPVPNPSVAGNVRLSFTLPSGGEARLDVYDIAGRRVWETAMSGLAPGEHGVSWDGRSSAGRPVGAGVYHVRLTTPNGSRTVKLVRLGR